jgi:hypothetical protein
VGIARPRRFAAYHRAFGLGQLQVGFRDFIGVHHGAGFVDRGHGFHFRASVLNGLGEQGADFIE